MKPFASTIANLLDDATPAVAALAVRALRGLQLKPHLPKIASLLHHPDRGVRFQAVLSLGGAGPSAFPHAADLVMHLRDTVRIQRAVRQALSRLDVLELVDWWNLDKFAWR